MHTYQVSTPSNNIATGSNYILYPFYFEQKLIAVNSWTEDIVLPKLDGS